MKNNSTFILIGLFLIFGPISFSQVQIDSGGLFHPNTIVPEYETSGTYWDHKIITFSLENGTSDIPDNDVIIGLRQALSLWQEFANLIFVEVCNSDEADIIFNWAIGDHGCGFPFDGPGNILAHAFYPGSLFAGEIHFDDDEMWTLSTRTNSNQPIDLITIAAHEIGHALGLKHSTVYSAVMHSIYSRSKRNLDQDDINGIRSIYGIPNGNSYYTGNSLICSSGDTIKLTEQIPINWDISWEFGPHLNIESGGESINSIFLKGVGSGKSWHRAVINTGCDIIELPKREIWVGSPIISQIEGSFNVPNNSWTTYKALFESNSQINAFEWILNPLNGNVIYNYGSTSDIAFYNTGQYQLLVRAKNTCTLPDFGDFTVETLNVYNPLSMKISPNPSSGEVNIFLILKDDEKNFHKSNLQWDLELYNNMNQLIIEKKEISSSNITLRIHHLEKGLYFIKIRYNNEILSSKLIIN